jgi:hypothetical protein
MTQQDRPPTEEELRQAYEAELKRLRVDDLLVQTIVSVLNLAGRRAGLVPGAEDERDLGQVRTAIESVRALLPLVESELGPDAARIREALSQLQMAYAQLAGGGEEPQQGPPAPEQKPAEPGQSGPGPAQSSGRLWVPGQ